MSKLNWTVDPSAEQVLSEFGVKFTTDAVAMSDIDWDASRSNHARILGKPIDEDLVDDYAQGFANGDEFPMPVVRKAGKKYVIVGGNHRLSALERFGGTQFQAYVVNPDDKQTMDLLPRVLNRRGGRRTTKDEAFQHAMYAVKEYGMTIRQAAQLFGLSDKAVSAKIAFNETRSQLVGMGVPQAAALGDSAIKALNSLKDNDNVLQAAAQIVIKSKMTGDDAAVFAKEVKQARTENSKIAVVAEYEEKLGTRNGNPENKKTRKLVRVKFLRSLTTLESVVKKANTLARVQITEPTEQKNVSRRLLDLSSKCRHLARSN